MLSAVISCLLALAACTPTQAALQTYPVTTAKDLTTALNTIAQGVAKVDVLFLVQDHLVTNFTIQDSLANVNSLAMVGNCSTPPPAAADRGSLITSTPKTGACALSLGQTTQFSGAGTLFYRQLYFDNMLIYAPTPVPLTFEHNTVWLVDSELSGFQGATLHLGSIYVIDSAVTNVTGGLAALLSGSLTDTGDSSEATYLVSRSTIQNDKAGSAQLTGDITPPPMVGYVVLHNSTIAGSTDAGKTFFIGVQAPDQMVHYYHDTSVVTAFFNSTVVMDMPYSATNPPALNYTTASSNYLTMLETAKVAGVAKAMSPVSDTAALPPGTPMAPPPGTPAAAPPPGTPVLPPPGGSPSPTGAAASLTWSAALGIALLAAACL